MTYYPDLQAHMLALLDPYDASPLLVYNASRKASKDGSLRDHNWTQRSLHFEVLNNERFRVSRKAINGASGLDIYQRDKFVEPEKSLYADMPNMGGNIAAIYFSKEERREFEWVWIVWYAN